MELRYYLTSPHYRSTIDYSRGGRCARPPSAFRRMEGFLSRAAELAGERSRPATVPAAFAEAMDDDLAVPQALAVVHGAVREGNAALAAGDKDAVAERYGEVRAMLGVLGLDPLDRALAGRAPAATSARVVDALVAVALEQRQEARARKDYADRGRDPGPAPAAGIVVEDTPPGPRWTLGER